MAKENATSAFDKLAKPAQRALAGEGISSVEQLSKLTEAELIQLHGIGKNAVITIKKILADHNLSFSVKK